MMALPLQHEGTVVAIAACASVTRDHAWSDDSETELRLLLEKITDAKRQAESTLAIFRREKDLSLSEELASLTKELGEIRDGLGEVRRNTRIAEAIEGSSTRPGTIFWPSSQAW